MDESFSGNLPGIEAHDTIADVCAGFGVGQSTASAKAQVISRVLDAHRLNPKWSLPSLLEQNPLVWMAEVNGLLIDLRNMPREVQEVAFEKGMIPYIPADRERDQAAPPIRSASAVDRHQPID
jgi:hypothetical protein